MSKFGWIGGSLVAHATLLLLTVTTGAVGEFPDETQATWETGSAASAELLDWVEVAPLVPAEAVAPAQKDPPSPPAEKTPSEPPEPQPDEPPSDEEVDEAIPRETLPAKPDLPVKRAPEKIEVGATKEPVRTPATEPAARNDRDAAKASDDGEDWLRIEDQLPEPPKEQPAATQRPEPRDALVERLLAAERRKSLDRRRAEERRSEPLVDAPAPVRAPAVPTSAIASKGPEDLADKFTRAVTQAEKANPFWARHVVGTVGSVRVWLRLESGVLQEPRFESGGSEPVVALVHRTLHLLRRGEFALPFSTERNGEHLLEITVRLSEVDDVNRYAYEPPTKTRPGRAYFVLPDGRLFEAFINPNPKR